MRIGSPLTSFGMDQVRDSSEGDSRPARSAQTGAIAHSGREG